MRSTVSSSRKSVASGDRAGWPGGEVERVEVVPRRLDLASVDDAVAEPEEDVLDLAADLGDQMQPSARVAADRERHVDPLLAQAAVELGARQLGVARLDRRLDPLARGVQAHPGLAVAHLAQRELERALATEVLDANGLDRVGRARRGDRSEGRLLERLVVHRDARG